MLTPAELAALQQVTSGGRQSLVLNNLGTAIGGTVQLNSMSTNAASVVIPHGVTGLADFSTQNILPLMANLTNFGSVYAFTTSRLNQSGTISAENIFNQRGAVISSIIPTGLVARALGGPFDLGLSAANSIVNDGLISARRQFAH